MLSENDKPGRYDFAESAAQGTHAAPATEPKGPALAEAVEQYLDREVRTGVWAVRSEEQVRQYLGVLVQLVGAETRLSEISKKTANYVADSLLKLPANAAKNPATRDKTLNELITQEHKRTLSVKTVNSYLKRHKALFTWAVKSGLLTENPFEHAPLPKKAEKPTERGAFSLEQLRAIEAVLISGDDKLVPKSAHKWATLIMMYTGARLNEVCQLKLSDVRKHEDIWCFDLNEEGEGKSLKNKSSKRIIPVRSRLFALGFLEYVERLRRDNEARLFPELSYSPKHKWGRNVGVWINNTLLVRLEYKSKSIVAHSFRHSVTTHLMHADVQLPMTKAYSVTTTAA